jgi:hypothetical protein
MENSSMEGHGGDTRAAAGGAFGAILALVTASTPVGVAIVAALGAGLAVVTMSRGNRRGEPDSAKR